MSHGHRRQTSLSELPARPHCQLCCADISYEIELDQAIEATFMPSPRAAHPEPGPFCIGGPMRTPHVVAQAILPAAGSVAFNAPERAGRYHESRARRRERGARSQSRRRGAARFHVDAQAISRRDADGDLEDRCRPSWRTSRNQPERRRRATRQARAPGMGSRAATAHLVSTLPEFRRQFSGIFCAPVSRCASLRWRCYSPI